MPRRLRRLLRRLHRERRVVGERHEHVELLVGRAEAAHGPVDRDDPEQMPVGVAHRQEERVLRMPGAGFPVARAGRDDVGAAAAEAGAQQRLPFRVVAHLPEEGGLRAPSSPCTVVTQKSSQAGR